MNAIAKKLLGVDAEKKVEFIIMYGSKARGDETPLSDTDIAVYHAGEKRERFKFRISASGLLGSKFDVQTFQDLPLYVRKEVLKGKILYAKKKDFLYDVAISTIKEYERFRKHLQTYYEGVEQDGRIAANA